MPPTRRGAGNGQTQGSGTATAPAPAQPQVSREEFSRRVRQARQVQVKAQEAGKNFFPLQNYVGYVINVAQLLIDENAPTQFGPRRMLRVIDDEGSTFYSGTAASLDNAEPIIQTLGSDPYPFPVQMIVKGRTTRHGDTCWVEILDLTEDAEQQDDQAGDEPVPF